MRADRKPGSGGVPERESLRSILRHWEVPGPPREIEEELRRTFRRRRSSRRRTLWLSAAAGLTLLVLWQIKPSGRPLPPALPERPIAVASPSPPPPTTVKADGAGNPAPPSLSPVREHRRPTAAPADAEVIVEPGQAELLAVLGRQLRGVRQAAPGTTTPRIEVVRADAPATPVPTLQATDVPRYRGDWETVAVEWPFVHRSVPTGGR
jgi:hypothetical protein